MYFVCNNSMGSIVDHHTI